MLLCEWNEPTAEKDIDGFRWSLMSQMLINVSTEQVARTAGSKRCQCRSLTTRVCDLKLLDVVKSAWSHVRISVLWLLEIAHRWEHWGWGFHSAVPTSHLLCLGTLFKTADGLSTSIIAKHLLLYINISGWVLIVEYWIWKRKWCIPCKKYILARTVKSHRTGLKTFFQQSG